MSARLSLAVQSGDLALSGGPVLVFGPGPDADLSAVPGATVVQPFRPDHDIWAARGFDVVARAGDRRCDDAVVFLPRAKAAARGAIAQAMTAAQGRVIVDGAKTDGVDSLLRDMRRRVPVQGPISKAHGKLFWLAADPDAFADWTPQPSEAEGFVTAPGVFAEGRIDPASRALAQALPDRLGRHVADLGAGWGFLSACALRDRPEIETLDLVEADAIALDCARLNVTDARARFHWADATAWQPGAPLDAVLMNPPFHAGRSADPQIGRAFIAAAGRALGRNGALWMVANRHLPYEAALSDAFQSVTELPGTPAFKLFRAERPSRARR